MFDFSTLSTELVFACALLLFTVIESINWFSSYLKIIIQQKERPINNSFPPVSVVICAKNEGENLTEFLPKILLQNYPTFEVVVVNDCSYDNTADVLREYAKEFPNLKIITIKEDDYYKHGKKFALMIGIKGSQYEHLLLTDGDCYPNSENWIKEMVSTYENNIELVLGYGAYQKERGFLNKLIRFDTFRIAVNYLSAAVKNKAYMGVGRNLSYKKEIFFRHKGFSSHYHIPSGDDDLLVNKEAKAGNIAVNFNPDAFTYSVPEKTFKNWTNQKARHLITSAFYTRTSRNRLIYSHLLPYFVFVFFISCILFYKFRLFAILIFSLRILYQSILNYKAMKKFQEQDLFFYFPIFEIVMLFCNPYFQFRRFVRNNTKWKN